jgi:hypothetical protein
VGVDGLLSQRPPTFPPSGRNLLLALRMKLARTRYELMTYAPRLLVAITYNIDGHELPENVETNERRRLIAQDHPLFDADAARVINRRFPGLRPYVLAWAQRASNAPRVPEALHLVVRATRIGCTDADTGAFSKAAYDLLHQCYPKSPWAQKTKYWYK